MAKKSNKDRVFPPAAPCTSSVADDILATPPPQKPLLQPPPAPDASLSQSDKSALATARDDMYEVVREYEIETGTNQLASSFGEPSFEEMVGAYRRASFMAKAVPAMRLGDQQSMVVDVLPEIQFGIIETAMMSSDEKLRFEASKFVLAQAGCGEVKKIQHQMEYDVMPENQLMTLIASKIAAIRKFNPAFDPEKMILLKESDGYTEIDENGAGEAGKDT